MSIKGCIYINFKFATLFLFNNTDEAFIGLKTLSQLKNKIKIWKYKENNHKIQNNASNPRKITKLAQTKILRRDFWYLKIQQFT
jgi:hypothetical protein